MKRKILPFIIVLLFAVLLVPACSFDANSSIKSVSKPYIAQYECIEGRFGEENFLDKYDYIRIILLDSEKMQVVYKYKDGDKKIEDGQYTLDFDTREIEGEIGILGFKFKEKVKVERGGFVISKIIFNKEFFMKFAVI